MAQPENTTLLVLTGPHGSGKTTMAAALEQAGLATRLRPVTTRERRSGEPDEYVFASDDTTDQDDLVWRYEKSGVTYGLQSAEVQRIPAGQIGVTPVHTEGLRAVMAAQTEAKIVTIGLDTIANSEDQFERVGRILGRAQGREAMAQAQRITRSSDYCLTGDQNSIFSQIEALISSWR